VASTSSYQLASNQLRETEDWMAQNDTSLRADYGPGRYEIRIKGHLHERWADWLEGMAFEADADGTTKLIGPLADQAALHGVLSRLRDLGLPIISVQRLSPI
jgi:hypothetical protein